MRMRGFSITHTTWTPILVLLLRIQNIVFAQHVFHSLPQQVLGNTASSPVIGPVLRPSYYPPVLKVKSREGFLYENAEIGTHVRILPDLRSDALQILVEDRDLKPGMPPAIYQYVLHGYGAEKFAVDQRGYLFLNTAGGLDADTNSSTYQLHVQAREVDTEPLRSSDPISLTIHLLDQNDNLPIFQHPFYVANVSASGPAERFVAKVVATDLDAGKFGRLTYRIVDATDGSIGQFRYDLPTNSLVVMGDLIAGHRYQVTMEAVDGGGLVGRAIVFVNSISSTNADSRNHRISSVATATSRLPSTNQQPLLPITNFQSTIQNAASPARVSSQVQTIVTELSEATPPNSIVAVLGDDNTRDEIYFKIVDGNEQQRFAINRNSGTVTTAKDFDREQTDLYTLQIEARSITPDQSLYWTLLQVAITDVNDNSPVWEGDLPLYIHLSIDDIEAFRPNMRVGKVKAKDADKSENGRVSYRIVDDQRLFKVDESTGTITVNGDFTTEHFGEHRLRLIAADHGDPRLETPATLILRIDGSVYTQATSPQTLTASSSSADYEEPEETTEAPLLFSRATLPPQFTSESASAQPTDSQSESHEDVSSQSETTTETTPSTTLATTTTKLMATQTAHVSSRSTITTKTTHVSLTPRTIPVDTTTTPQLRLAPVFNTPLLQVMVDENDSDLELATMEAHYPDDLSGPITYLMRSGDTTRFHYTGKLILLKPLDAETDREFTIVIGTAEASSLATDSNLAHTATVTVRVLDVNDWIPAFETNNYHLNVADNTEPGTIVGQVTAFDQDRDDPNNRIHYRVASTDGTEKLFSVNAENGLLTLNHELKEMTGKKLTLLVEASDEGEPAQSTQTTVTIDIDASETQVIPKNEKPRRPVPGTIQFSQRNYTSSVLESVRPPHLVQTLTVISKPKDPRFIMCAIVSGNYRQAFSISPNADGNCELRTQSALDREVIERYLLNVTVTSELQTDFALIAVVILDVNDNPPKFQFASENSAGAYFVGISSEAPESTRVLTVKAEDADLGAAGQVRYEIDTLSTDAKFFSVDEQTGELKLKQSMIQLMQNNKRNNFELKVAACDSPTTGQRLCSKADVFVNAVTDQHRFVTTIQGAQPQQIRAHEQDLIRAIRQFTNSCSLISMEGMRERTNQAMSNEPNIEVYWFAQNPQTHKVCRKKDIKTLFEKTSVDLLTGKLKPWFRLANMQDNVGRSESSTGLTASGILASIEWNDKTMIAGAVALSIAVCGLFAVCGVCVYWQRRKNRRNHVHTYPNIYPLPKYNSAIYVPGGGTLERDKIYETQMLELPMSDEDFATLKQSSIRSDPRLSAPTYRFQNQPPYRQIPNRPPHGAFTYGRPLQDDGDFSMEESMYAVNTPGRLDPFTKRFQPFQMIPTPDYSYSNQHHNKSIH
ncbi:Cadherin domain containing protein [Aphelenchoides besseyi]|nr:Cadherin domain containing protein [Aphelenchoides besseyi]